MRYNLGDIVDGAIPTSYMPDLIPAPTTSDAGVLMGVGTQGEVIPISAVTTDGGSLPVMPAVPNFTAAQMPSMPATANAAVQQSAPAITPQYLNQRLPSIVSNVPMDMSLDDCDPVSKWARDNPMMAVGVLALAYLVFVGRK